MKPILIIIAMTFFLQSCEIFVIKGTRYEREPVVVLTQKTPIGVVYLFRAELDSNNLYGAMSIIASPIGKKYLAIERYEKKEEISGIRRFISNRTITDIQSDTLSNDTVNFHLEFDWSKRIKFTASKISDEWFIVDYQFLH